MKTTLFKKVLAATLVGAMAISMVACGDTADADADANAGTDKDAAADAGDDVDADKDADADKEPSGDVQTISFWAQGTEGGDKEIYDEAVAKTNAIIAEQGYEIERTAIQNDTYKERIIVAMSSSQCPDMYVSWAGGPMNEYVDSGFAQPLTDLVLV